MRAVRLALFLGLITGVPIPAAAQTPPPEQPAPLNVPGPPPLATDLPPLPPIDLALPTLFLVGDSTVKVGTAGQMGEGAALSASLVAEGLRALGGPVASYLLPKGR